MCKSKHCIVQSCRGGFCSELPSEVRAQQPGLGQTLGPDSEHQRKNSPGHSACEQKLIHFSHVNLKMRAMFKLGGIRIVKFKRQ